MPNPKSRWLQNLGLNFILVLLPFTIGISHAQWVQITPVKQLVGSFSVMDPYIFLRDSEGDVSRSKDSAASWTKADSGLPHTILRLEAIDSTLFAGSWGRGLFRSSDKGESWHWSNAGMPDTVVIEAIHKFGDAIYTGTDMGMYRSIDSGYHWTEINLGLPPGTVISNITGGGKNLFFEAWGLGVFRSSDSGATWTSFNDGLPPKPELLNLWSTDSSVFALVNTKGLYRTSVNASLWSRPVGMSDTVNAYSFVKSGNDLYIGTFKEGVYRSLDDGRNWIPVNSGLPERSSGASLAVFRDNLYVATMWDTWRRPLSQFVSAIQPRSKLPARSLSSRNWNGVIRPGTQIEFDVQHQGKVELGVYDTRGNKVGILVNTELATGVHTATFEGVHLSGGIYILNLHANGLGVSRKILFER